MQPAKPKSSHWLLCLLIIMMGCAGSALPACGQEIHGFKVLAIPNGITLLKFRDKIEKWDFAKSGLFTVNVDDGVKLRILCLVSDPATTQMSVTEGTRTHVFNIEIKTKNVDINTFNGFYDYSDLKALKKQIAAGATKPNLTASEPPAASASAKQPAQGMAEPPKHSKADKDRKQREKNEAALAKKEKEEAAQRQDAFEHQQAEEKAQAEAALREKQRAKEEAAEKLAAADAEKQRLKTEKAARAQAAKEEKARQQQLEEENKKAVAAAKAKEENEAKIRRQEEKEAQEAEARRQKEIASAKEKDRQALIAKATKEKSAREKRQKEAAERIAAQKLHEEVATRERLQQIDAEKKAQALAEKQRAAEDAAAEKRETAIEAERTRQEEIARKKEEELAKEQKRKEGLAARQEQDRIRRAAEEAEKRRQQEERAAKAQRDAELEAARAQERQDALIKNPYWKSDWHKKYPDINFAEVPPGQSITGEYFLEKDTLVNNAVAREVLNDDAHMNRKSEPVNGVIMVMEGITFSGVNSFYRIRIVNKSKEDFLVGKMMVTWWKKDGGSFYLVPCYITEFPVIRAGEDAILVYGCRQVNAADKDDFLFSLKERRHEDQELQIYYTGSLYNKELKR